MSLLTAFAYFRFLVDFSELRLVEFQPLNKYILNNVT